MSELPRFARFGNELYTGKRSYNFVGRYKLWFIVAAAAILLSILIPVVKGGFNLGIDFRGGSEFTVSGVENTEVSVGEEAVAGVVSGSDPRVTNISPGTMRIQTEELSDDETLEVKAALAEDYGVTEDNVTSTFIGPTWGNDVSRQALVGLVVFVALAAILMALYFRTWKMSLAAVTGLLAVMITTAGLYSLSGFEVTPSAIIGFLTVLSYSLYDTVVVFDKIRENTANLEKQTKRTFAEQVNLAVNQTLVRSINTSVVAVLPVASVLFIGAYLLGAGTLKDLSLALFIGIILGTLGTLFVAAPLYAWLRRKEPEIVKQAKRVNDQRAHSARSAAVPTAAT
ncbi:MULTISPECIES: protein translocase subunit SecF [Arthrobacter]|uniref:Protein-export membrane protein SecF n=1 Tax=Arthrobacter caoxuetaonis TaxID=2886935 RepID=A0A9X1MEN6_9MICC|nr:MULTISPECIES: protein translocase subunit SecF [Arthrobacter]MCC3282672.1 protein translocase subunit SecF [Arthrobacter caoxuetaonis]MCC3297810.1 protein translocase subunit SecF [Arthrobacter caoxuetaonis]MCC9193648.1 protein translocase subunit SecF [Arthrobacter sp. zg-Y916]USQ55998.1 protein translocase subunit SecF [Arthrobacter caoxuetaonis]